MCYGLSLEDAMSMQTSGTRIVKEEFKRVSGVFLSYAKFVGGGMVVATLFLIVYAGVKSELFALDVVTAAITTSFLLVSAAVAYFSVLRVRETISSKERVVEALWKEMLSKSLIGSHLPSPDPSEMPKEEIERLAQQLREILDGGLIENMHKNERRLLHYQFWLLQDILYSSTYMTGKLIGGIISGMKSGLIGETEVLSGNESHVKQ